MWTHEQLDTIAVLGFTVWDNKADGAFFVPLTPKPVAENTSVQRAGEATESEQQAKAQAIAQLNAELGLSSPAIEGSQKPATVSTEKDTKLYKEDNQTTVATVAIVAEKKSELETKVTEGLVNNDIKAQSNTGSLVDEQTIDNMACCIFQRGNVLIISQSNWSNPHVTQAERQLINQLLMALCSLVDGGSGCKESSATENTVDAIVRTDVFRWPPSLGGLFSGDDSEVAFLSYVDKQTFAVCLVFGDILRNFLHERSSLSEHDSEVATIINANTMLTDLLTQPAEKKNLWRLLRARL